MLGQVPVRRTSAGSGSREEDQCWQANDALSD